MILAFRNFFRKNAKTHLQTVKHFANYKLKMANSNPEPQLSSLSPFLNVGVI